MGAPLRVDPTRLREAARTQADVAASVSRMATGQTVANAGTGMSGLLTEKACQFAGTAFNVAAGAVNDELTAHSGNLEAAADRYHRTDQELGRRLRKVPQ